VLAGAIALAGMAPTVLWLLPPIAVVGLSNGALNVTLGSLVMGRTLAAERGRVSALLTGVASGTQIVAFAAGGALATVLAPRTIFIATGLLGILVPLLLGPGLIRTARATASAAEETPAAALTESPVGA